jgi:hypothetical protein
MMGMVVTMAVSVRRMLSVRMRMSMFVGMSVFVSMLMMIMGMRDFVLALPSLDLDMSARNSASIHTTDAQLGPDVVFPPALEPSAPRT